MPKPVLDEIVANLKEMGLPTSANGNAGQGGWWGTEHRVGSQGWVEWGGSIIQGMTKGVGDGWQVVLVLCSGLSPSDCGEPRRERLV